MKKLVLASHNAGKLVEMQEILPICRCRSPRPPNWAWAMWKRPA